MSFFQSRADETPDDTRIENRAANSIRSEDKSDRSEQNGEIVHGDGATAELRSAVVEALRTVYDPEIPIDIYELGLVYGVEIDKSQNAFIKMTLTSPMCPVAGELPAEVELKIRQLDEIRSTQLEVVWDPPWSPTMMSEAAKLTLGF
ncbi:MAG: hypothetical protein CME06_05270 [Gemmatimonadetes bacterium]|nr:hypothetical protein [Gemmatimonadota bacterium]